MRYDVTALGELLIDFASLRTDEEGYPTMAAQPGGAPCNYLAALSAYGRKTAFLGKVGTDAFGQLLIGTLEKAGIDTCGILRDDDVFTTLAFVTFDETGDRRFSFARKPGADTCLRLEELDFSLIERARAFHFGSLSLTDEPARHTTQGAVAYARERKKLITFDPNLRISLWRSMEEARGQILWGLTMADIVKISEEEVDFLWSCGAEEGARRLLDTFGVSLAMVTRGPNGCYVANKNGSAAAQCPPVICVDTTGAGDIFGGAAVSRILGFDKQPCALAEEELAHVAAFATTAASLSTRRRGGIPSIPTQEEVLETMNAAL